MGWIEVAKTGRIPDGTMKHIRALRTELCIVNDGGIFYAVGDRCPHMNASLSMGTLEGTMVTCPLHNARFDVKTGKKLSGPGEPKINGMGIAPPEVTEYLMRITAIIAPIRTCDLQVFPTKTERGRVFVDI